MIAAIATFSPMIRRLACHLPSAALVPDVWGQTSASLAAAGMVAFTCELASLDHADLFIQSHPQFALLGIEMELDVRAAQGEKISPASLALLSKRRGAILLRLTSSDRHDKPSAPRAMPMAALAVTQLAKAAATKGIAVALDHRVGCWMQRVEDAVRVAMRVNRSDVGVLFNHSDWLAADGDAALLPERIKLALPKLMAVGLRVRSIEATPAERTVDIHGQPVDVKPLMQLLTQGGYTGPLLLRPSEMAL